MPAEKPVVYILRGDDQEAIEAHIQKAFDSLGSPDMADLNTTHLDGKTTTLNDLRAAALAVPFLTERRLVVVEDALRVVSRSGSGNNQRGDKKTQSDFLELLVGLPGTTALVLVVPDTMKNRKRSGVWESYWQTLNSNHWLIKWCHSAGDRAFIQDCPLPTGGEMVKWIQEKAQDLGGNFNPRAAQTLMAYLGNDTQRAAQEIERLLTYVIFERPVDDADVQLLSIPENQSDIFDMVDALGSKDGVEAMRQMHLLLENNDFIPVFSMVVRQFRLILQAREILDEGGSEKDVEKLLHQRSFVARKVCAQAGRFPIQQLESIYQKLQKIDVDMKTGVMQGDVAMELFITRLTTPIR